MLCIAWASINPTDDVWIYNFTWKRLDLWQFLVLGELTRLQNDFSYGLNGSRNCSRKRTGARALATRGRASPVQVSMRIIGALLTANRALNGLEIERRSTAYIHRITSLTHSSYASLPRLTLRYGLRTDLGGCEIPKLFCVCKPP